MAITIANPTEELEDHQDDDLFQEEDTTYNFRELMDQVSKLRDCIITVPSEFVEELKLGLITRKSKDNTKLKAAGIITDSLVLAFRVYPAKDKNGADIDGIMDVRVQLRPKKGVPVIDIRVPDEL